MTLNVDPMNKVLSAMIKMSVLFPLGIFYVARLYYLESLPFVVRTDYSAKLARQRWNAVTTI